MSAQRITSISVALFLLALNLPEIVAQAVSILPTTPSSTFPACALGCSNLNAAASYCVQTNVGASQQTVNSCFCQRAEVTPFYVSSAGVCDAFCISDTDRSTLQAWFQTYCAAAGFSAGSGGTVTTLITSTRTPTATATGAPKAGSGTDSTSSSSQNDGWFATHWKWIVMVIVLVVGLSALAVLAVCLKRRHARKVHARRVASSGFPAAQSGSSPDIGHGRDMWGPHQHMAHTGGWEYTSEQDREMREASAAAGGGVLGVAVGKAKNLNGDSKKRLGKKSRHGSQRSARNAEADSDRFRREEDENTRIASAAIRRSKSERRREREEEREREKEVERGLRGLPIKNRDERVRKEKQKADVDSGSEPVISEKEKDIS